MPETQALHRQLDRFRLNVNGHEAFPVYWINTPDFGQGFRSGKGTPEEMQERVDRLVAKCNQVGEEMNVTDSGSARNFLNRNQIGTDCSNLVYQIADGVVTNRGMNLQQYLFIPRQDVLVASQKWKDIYAHSDEEKAGLPDNVPLDWVVQTYNKDPQFQVNVERLALPAASDVVERYADAQPGDLIIMKKGDIFKHVAMVTGINGKDWEVWDSYRTDTEQEGYGGVMRHEVSLVEFNAPLPQQSWQNFKTARYDKYELRRLKAFGE